jgi:hypothetical protein
LENTAMDAIVMDEEDRVFLKGIPRLEWGKGMETSFIRSVQVALNALGETYSYDFLMGISGAIFRIHVHPEWCPSAVDMTTGFDLSRDLFSSLGYHGELVVIDDNNPEEIRSLYRRIREQIDRGIPIVAINLKTCPEWGIITGYLKRRPGILCRTFFDEGDRYSLAEHAPWLSFFISKSGNPVERKVLVRRSLERGILLWESDRFGDYYSGRSAFEFWIKALRDYINRGNSQPFPHAEENRIYFNFLTDSRAAAYRFFQTLEGETDIRSVDRIITKYGEETALLTNAMETLLPPFHADPGLWTPELLEKQSMVLEDALAIETDIQSFFQELHSRAD